jgi:hypothetical protein
VQIFNHELKIAKNSPTLCDLILISSSQIAVSQESAVVIGFEPVIEMHFIAVGSHEFFSQAVFQINVTLLHAEDRGAGARFLASEYC